jgi:hypothetical protein
MLPSGRRTTWRRRRGRDTEDGELQPSSGEGVSDIGIEGGGRGVGLQEEDGGEDREVVGAATVDVAGEGATAAGSPVLEGWAGRKWDVKATMASSSQRRWCAMGSKEEEEDGEAEEKGSTGSSSPRRGGRR